MKKEDTRTIRSYSLTFLAGAIAAYALHRPIDRTAFAAKSLVSEQKHEYIGVDDEELVYGSKKIPFTFVDGTVQLGNSGYRIKGLEEELENTETRDQTRGQILGSGISTIVIDDLLHNPEKYDGVITSFYVESAKMKVKRGYGWVKEGIKSLAKEVGEWIKN